MPSLVVLEGSRAASAFPVPMGRTTVGRGEQECDFVIPDPLCSRVQWIIDRGPDGAFVTPRGDNETWLDGEPLVERRPLPNDGTLQVANTRVQYRDPPGGAERPRVTGRLVRPSASALVAARNDLLVVHSPWFVFVEGPLAGKRVELTLPNTVLGGRGDPIDLQIPELVGPAAIATAWHGRVTMRPQGAVVIVAGQVLHGDAPLEPGDLVRIGPHTIRFERLQRKVVPERGETAAPRFTGRSAVLEATLAYAEEVGGHDVTALVYGESGTGKEDMARFIHDSSPRADRPFLSVNVAASDGDLARTLLLGHEAGAFTSAVGRRDGLFVRANGGTLFIDEVGDASPEVQLILLKVIEDGVVEVVGGVPVKVDVRIVAATNRNLQELVKKGLFREDLMHRLTVAVVFLPPLRERAEDIPDLAEEILRLRTPAGRSYRFAEGALEPLLKYSWPGNIRELRNVIVRGMISARDGVITAAHLQPGVDPWDRPASPISSKDYDDDQVRELYRVHDGNVTDMSKATGLSRRTIGRMLERVFGKKPKKD